MTAYPVRFWDVTLKLKEFMDNGTIQIAPLAFMRGRTLNDAFVILDEAQNIKNAGSVAAQAVKDRPVLALASPYYRRKDSQTRTLFM